MDPRVKPEDVRIGVILKKAAFGPPFLCSNHMKNIKHDDDGEGHSEQPQDKSAHKSSLEKVMR